MMLHFYALYFSINIILEYLKAKHSRDVDYMGSLLLCDTAGQPLTDFIDFDTKH